MLFANSFAPWQGLFATRAATDRIRLVFAKMFDTVPGADTLI